MCPRTLRTGNGEFSRRCVSPLDGFNRRQPYELDPRLPCTIQQFPHEPAAGVGQIDVIFPHGPAHTFGQVQTVDLPQNCGLFGVEPRITAGHKRAPGQPAFDPGIALAAPHRADDQLHIGVPGILGRHRGPGPSPLVEPADAPLQLEGNRQVAARRSFRRLEEPQCLPPLRFGGAHGVFGRQVGKQEVGIDFPAVLN